MPTIAYLRIAGLDAGHVEKQLRDFRAGERIQGCFSHSMNTQASSAGGPPAADSDTMVSLVAYSFWLATGAPTGDNSTPGRGYPRLKETSQGFDPDRGATVYAAKCALCHGNDGTGVTHRDGRTLFPPL